MFGLSVCLFVHSPLLSVSLSPVPFLLPSLSTLFLSCPPSLHILLHPALSPFSLFLTLPFPYSALSLSLTSSSLSALLHFSLSLTLPSRSSLSLPHSPISHSPSFSLSPPLHSCCHILSPLPHSPLFLTLPSPSLSLPLLSPLPYTPLSLMPSLCAHIDHRNLHKPEVLI